MSSVKQQSKKQGGAGGGGDSEFQTKNAQLIRDCIPCGCYHCHYGHDGQICSLNLPKEKQQQQQEPEFLFTGHRYHGPPPAYGVATGVSGFGLSLGVVRPPPPYYDPYYYDEVYYNDPYYYPGRHVYPVIPRARMHKRGWMKRRGKGRGRIGGKQCNGEHCQSMIEACENEKYANKEKWMPLRMGLLDYAENGTLALGGDYRSGLRVPEESHVCVKSRDRIMILSIFGPHFRYLFYQRNRSVTVESAPATIGMARSEKHHKALLSVYKTLGIHGAGGYEPHVVFEKIFDRVTSETWVLVAPQTNARYLQISRDSGYDVLNHWTAMLAVETSEMMNKHYDYIPSPHHEIYVSDARAARKIPPSMTLRSDKDFFWTVLAQSALVGYADASPVHERLSKREALEIEKVREDLYLAASPIGGNFGNLFSYSEEEEIVEKEIDISTVEYGGALDNVQPLFHRHDLLVQVAVNKQLSETRSSSAGGFFSTHRMDKAQSHRVNAAIAKVAFDAWSWGPHTYVSDRAVDDRISGFGNLPSNEAMVLYDQKFISVYEKRVRNPWYYVHYDKITEDDEHVMLFGNLHAKNSIELAMMAKMSDYDFLRSFFRKWKKSELVSELFDHDSFMVRHYSTKIVKILATTTIRFLEKRGIRMMREKMTAETQIPLFSASESEMDAALLEISELRTNHLVKMSMIETSWSSYGPAEVKIMLRWLSHVKNMVMPVYYLNAMLQSLSRYEIESDKEKSVPLYEIF